MRVAVLCHLAPAALTELAGTHECMVPADGDEGARDEALEACDVAVVRSPVRLDAAALARAPQLKLIVRAGMGLDGIDCEEAARRGIRIVAVPSSADAAAEHAMALLLAIARDIVRFDRSLRNGRWEKHGERAPGLGGRTLGIVGFGRIGRRIAELASAFRMQLLAHDRTPERPPKGEVAAATGTRFVPLAELAERADFICCTLPADDGSRGILDAGWIARMRPGSGFVNVGRGGVVDESALSAALESGGIRSVALDVFAVEPPVGHPLLESERFVGTPHVAAQTDSAQQAIGALVVRTINAFAEGNNPLVDGVVGVVGQHFAGAIPVTS